MKTIRLIDKSPVDLIGSVCTAVSNGDLTIWYIGDDLPTNPPIDDSEAKIREDFEAKLAADKEAAYQQFKAANPIPTPKSSPPTMWQKTVAMTKSVFTPKEK